MIFIECFCYPMSRPCHVIKVIFGIVSPSILKPFFAFDRADIFQTELFHGKICFEHVQP